MAVEDKYVDSQRAADKLAAAENYNGSETYTAVMTFEVAVADDDGSVYRLFTVNGSQKIADIQINNDAITGGTDWDLGFYEPLVDGVGGDVKDKDKLVNGVTMASARVTGAELSGITALAIEELDETIYELAGDTVANRIPQYDIALTANTVGATAGTITVRVTLMQGSAN